MSGLYIIPDSKQPEEAAKFAKEHALAFEYNDFFMPAMLDDEAALEERIATYNRINADRDSTKDTMHGAFFDVTVFSFDAKIREVSLLRMRQSMEIARRMKLRAVIFHGNYLPFLRGESYDSNWLLQTEEAVRILAAEYPEIEIYMENMFEDSPKLLGELAYRLLDVPTFGICLDYSHALLNSKDGEPWFVCLAPYIRHIHVNDHCFAGDVHLIPGEGMTDWKLFFMLKDRYAPTATILCEVSGLDAAKKGIAFLEQQRK